MSRMRGSALARKKKKVGAAKPGVKAGSAKAKTKKVERRGGRGRARERDEDEDEDDARGRFGPPPAKNNTPLIIALVGGVLLIVLVAAMAGGGGSNLVDEHEAEKAYNYVDGQYALAKGGDALAENRAALRKAFEKVVETYPGTESAAKAEKRIRELQ